ncbi:hypothetical protein PoB_003174300 [Plakobranchus ocellatus]|uniref:Uncharacterized protein n=1 Tax=Plakobranchus ocellatus TaxID=259542 RepID=A0AAV4AEK7_9GAST|nr:hypothetical protein PoB_003174300 [Plakobranchus ocellatus]
MGRERARRKQSMASMRNLRFQLLNLRELHARISLKPGADLELPRSRKSAYFRSVSATYTGDQFSTHRRYFRRRETLWPGARGIMSKERDIDVGWEVQREESKEKFLGSPLFEKDGSRDELAEKHKMDDFYQAFETDRRLYGSQGAFMKPQPEDLDFYEHEVEDEATPIMKKKQRSVSDDDIYHRFERWRRVSQGYTKQDGQRRTSETRQESVSGAGIKSGDQEVGTDSASVQDMDIKHDRSPKVSGFKKTFVPRKVAKRNIVPTGERARKESDASLELGSPLHERCSGSETSQESSQSTDEVISETDIPLTYDPNSSYAPKVRRDSEQSKKRSVKSLTGEDIDEDKISALKRPSHKTFPKREDRHAKHLRHDTHRRPKHRHDEVDEGMATRSLDYYEDKEVEDGLKADDKVKDKDGRRPSYDAVRKPKRREEADDSKGRRRLSYYEDKKIEDQMKANLAERDEDRRRPSYDVDRKTKRRDEADDFKDTRRLSYYEDKNVEDHMKADLAERDEDRRRSSYDAGRRTKRRDYVDDFKDRRRLSYYEDKNVEDQMKADLAERDEDRRRSSYDAGRRTKRRDYVDDFKDRRRLSYHENRDIADRVNADKELQGKDGRRPRYDADRTRPDEGEEAMEGAKIYRGSYGNIETPIDTSGRKPSSVEMRDSQRQLRRFYPEEATKDTDKSKISKKAQASRRKSSSSRHLLSKISKTGSLKKASSHLLKPMRVTWHFLKHQGVLVCDHPVLGELRPPQCAPVQGGCLFTQSCL